MKTNLILVLDYRKLCLTKVAFILEFHLFTRFAFALDDGLEMQNHMLSFNSFWGYFLCLILHFGDYQVERGKQAYYCYDDKELKKIQRSFPSNASYNIQRFKGIHISVDSTLLMFSTWYYAPRVVASLICHRSKPLYDWV